MGTKILSCTKLIRFFAYPKMISTPTSSRLANVISFDMCVQWHQTFFCHDSLLRTHIFSLFIFSGTSFGVRFSSTSIMPRCSGAENFLCNLLLQPFLCNLFVHKHYAAVQLRWNFLCNLTLCLCVDLGHTTSFLI